MTPKSLAETEDLIDYVVSDPDISDSELEDIAESVAPGSNAVLSIFTQLRSLPFVDEQILEYFTKRTWQEIKD